MQDLEWLRQTIEFLPPLFTILVAILVIFIRSFGKLLFERFEERFIETRVVRDVRPDAKASIEQKLKTAIALNNVTSLREAEDVFWDCMDVRK